jgi:hypothetical protein
VDHRGSPADQWYLVRCLCHRPGAPRGLCLAGHQHPVEHAVDPQHATRERARDLLGARLQSHRMPPRRSSTSSCVLRVRIGVREAATAVDSAAPLMDSGNNRRLKTSTVSRERRSRSQDIVDEVQRRACGSHRGQELVEACPNISPIQFSPLQSLPLCS